MITTKLCNKTNKKMNRQGLRLATVMSWEPEKIMLPVSKSLKKSVCFHRGFSQSRAISVDKQKLCALRWTIPDQLTLELRNASRHLLRCRKFYDRHSGFITWCLENCDLLGKLNECKSCRFKNCLEYDQTYWSWGSWRSWTRWAAKLFKFRK